MSRGKKKAPKGTPGMPGGKQPDKSTSGKPKRKAFSMIDEARHTDRGYDGNITGRRLEKRTMAFVSAGPAVDQSIEEASRQNQPIVVPRPSSSHSTSSEEVILFAGRNKSPRLAPKPKAPTQAQNRIVPHYEASIKNRTTVEQDKQSTQRSQKTFKSSRPLALSEDEIDSELLEDYIANMDPSSSSSEDVIMDSPIAESKGKEPINAPTDKHNQDLSPVLQLIAQQIEEARISNSQPGPEIALPYRIVEKHILRQPGESSTSSTKFNETIPAKEPESRQITTILSQRNGEEGMYYLVVYDNLDDDAAEWIRSEQLINMTSTALQFFESPMWETEDSESVDSEVQAEKDLEAMFNDELFEDEQLRKKQVSMTDEEIARRLAKQEEFGIDASEVVMFDGGETGGEPIEFLRQEAVRYTYRSKNVLQRMDSDSDFDLMDYERPSLKKKKKKGKPTFGVDPEMEQAMLATWENDRAKKKKRKETREELRSQGLLGGGAKAKYPNGIAIDELKEEIRHFLASDRDTLTLPPMDKTERKLVHEIAHNFNITSTSRGNGPDRHPTLIKKLRTRPFTDQAFDSITNRLLKRYRLVGAKRPGEKEKKRFTYKEGDVVGSNAPELGSENRGRMMLERMGWNTGDALGALNNPGILNPITHVVKSSRSGLG